MVDNRTIEFTAATAAVSRLTWGQEYIWRIIQSLVPADEHINFGLIADVPASCDDGGVEALIRNLMVSHDVLRASYITRNGSTLRVVPDRGKVTLARLDVADQSETKDAAQAMCDALTGDSFDLSQGSTRWGIVSCLGQPSKLIIGMSHMVTDAFGAEVLSEIVAEGLKDPDSAIPPATWTTSQQLAFEGSSAGLELASRAGRHWEQTLRRAPLAVEPSEADGEDDPRYWHGLLESRAMDAAAVILGRRLQLSSVSVVMCALGIALSAVNGQDEPLLIVRVANRSPGHPSFSSLCHLSQATPVLLPGRRDTFREAAHVTAEVTFDAYRHGRYAPTQVAALLDQVAETRGGRIDIMNTFNCNQSMGVAEASLLAYEGHVSDLLQQSRVTWIDKRSSENIKTFFYLRRHHQLSLFADTRFYPKIEIKRILRLVEHVLVSVADGEDNLDRVLAHVALP